MKGDCDKLKGNKELDKAEAMMASAFALAQHSDSVPEEKKALVIGRLMTRVILHLLGKEGKGQEKVTFQNLEEINNKFGATGALGTAPSSSGSKAEKEVKPVALQEPGKTFVHLFISCFQKIPFLPDCPKIILLPSRTQVILSIWPLRTTSTCS